MVYEKGNGVKAMPKTYTQTFFQPTFTRADGGKMPNDTGWQTRHHAAITWPQNEESPLVSLIGGWALYADLHKARYESGIGEDGVLGECWARIGVELLGLLNGESGRLDCGTLDGFIRDTLTAEGHNPG